MQRVPKATPPELDLEDYEWFTLRVRTTNDGNITVTEGKPFLAKSDFADGMRKMAQAEAKRKGSSVSILLYVYRATSDDWTLSWIPV